MRSILLLIVLAVALFAQPTPVPLPRVNGVMNITPQAVPASLTTVSVYDSMIYGVTVTNTTASPITFTLQSRQAVPVAFLSAVSVAANTTFVVSVPFGYWAVGGFSVQASGVGLTYYAQWGQ